MLFETNVLWLSHIKMSFIIHDTFHAEALEMQAKLEKRVEAAMNYASAKLGFNGWSRNLHDGLQAYAFLIPDDVFADSELVNTMEQFLINVFYDHFLSVDESFTMIDSSRDTIDRVMGEDHDNYEVDWLGSRSRDIVLGSHIYFRLSFTGWLSMRMRPDTSVPSCIADLNWEVITTHDNAHLTRQFSRKITHSK